MRYTEFTIEGRNAVIEAFRSGKTIDKLYVLDGCKDGPVMTIIREAKKHDTIIRYTEKELLDKKAASAKAAAAKKKEESDALTEVVFSALTDEFESIPDITAKVQEVDAEATVGKVQNRLNKLANAGRAEKAQAKINDGEGSKARKIVVYKAVAADAE